MNPIAILPQRPVPRLAAALDSARAADVKADPSGSGVARKRATHRARAEPRTESSQNGKSALQLRVLIVDDHKAMRHGLRSLLTDHADLLVIGEAEDGAAAVSAANALRPDVIIMDVAMPVMDGIEATRRIKASIPDVRVIGLSMFNEAEMIDRMLKAGAEVFLTKDVGGEQLLATIRRR